MAEEVKEPVTKNKNTFLSELNNELARVGK